jgi:regulator of PEP synthase PpsR (kinase-PPPase family)
MTKETNIHLISDSTGETLSSISRAVMSQFEDCTAKEFVWPLVRTVAHIERIISSVKQNPGIILYTILKDELIDKLRSHCSAAGLPCISAISPVVAAFSRHLNAPITKSIGRQHHLDQEYFNKVEAINYTITHDDGQMAHEVDQADIIIIGVSRASKSPTSIYLSCRGYKVANIPFVRIETIPQELFLAKKPVIVGLIINPDKLVQIRSTRIKSLGEKSKTDYVDIEKIKSEILESRKLYQRLKCPVIDVTRRSVEETAAQIISLVQQKKMDQSL